MTSTAPQGPFSQSFRNDFRTLLEWRRDVRLFQPDPIDPVALSRCLDTFELAPSVGLSQPTRVVAVKSEAARAAVLANFDARNAKALSGELGEKSQTFADLKRQSLLVAPEHFAVFCDQDVIGSNQPDLIALPELLRYSVAAAIMQFWFATRAEGIGLGWVSLLDAEKINADLDVDKSWDLVGYLCLGYPQQESNQPDLERLGLQERQSCPPILTR
ncbi:5,6-dimethylbenzimidazole synthase [Celeribacter neptunius]|uniref:Cob(II)yrinic acid a,c-diamide reductase n=1 Tax=Celeribacter neptunius TaxID=588602 RepID=A0A1I3QWK6_9RHOB|nr:5,6-dimethylbenzimidazole synthase [Celeribacter neptunius]SFJ37862.1 cob(II)yrinic acid a,c-diamide reductase [Celeribacter neptunius]